MADNSANAVPGSSEMKALVAQLLSSGVDERDRDRDGDDLQGSIDAEFEQMVPVIKNLFRTRKQLAFADELGQFAQAKQVEIERLCSYNYQVGTRNEKGA